LETYAYLPFAERVRATYAFLRESLAYVAARGAEVLALLDACREPPERVAVRYRLEPFADRAADILTREPYRLDGMPVSVRVPHIGRFVGEQAVRRPLAYAVPPPIAEHLARHGLPVEDDHAAVFIEAEIAVVRQHQVSAEREILEAATSVVLDVDYRLERRMLPAGWRLVYTAHQRGAIAVYLCEAGSDDGLLACGLIDPPVPGSEFPAWRVLRIASQGAAEPLLC
jgi:hypothetical protein